MGTDRRAVAPTTLGAWLIKVSPAAHPDGELAGRDFTTVASWCVRRSYRVDLISADQPLLLWISGASEQQPAGIHAVGRTTGGAVSEVVTGDDLAGGRGPARPGLRVPVEMRGLATPVLRTDLLGHPVLSGIEVLRMPAGSNPSFLTRGELAALRHGWPQVDAAL